MPTLQPMARDDEDRAHDARVEDVLKIPGNSSALKRARVALTAPNHRLVAVVGPAVSARTVRPWSEWLAQMLDHAIEVVAVNSNARERHLKSLRADPLSFAHDLKVMLGARCAGFMSTTFDVQASPQTRTTHDLVMALQVAGFVTTNYDTFLNDAWQRAFERQIQTHFDWSGYDPSHCDRFSDAIVHRPALKAIIHAHGSWHHHSSAIAIGGPDYAKLYAARWGQVFGRYFDDPGTPSLLWIGSGMDEPWMQAGPPSNCLRKTGAWERMRHFGIVPIDDPDPEAARGLRQRLQTDFGLEPIFYPVGGPYDPKHQHVYLDTVLRMLTEPEAKRRGEPAVVTQAQQMPQAGNAAPGAPALGAELPSSSSPDLAAWEVVDNTVVTTAPGRADLRREFAKWLISALMARTVLVGILSLVAVVFVGLLSTFSSALPVVSTQDISIGANLGLVSAALFWMALREPRATKRGGANVNEAAKRFLWAWRWVWLSWLFFFGILAAQHGDGPANGIYAADGSLPLMALDLANFAQAVAWYGAYVELDEATVGRPIQVANRKIVLLFGVVALHILIAVCLVRIEAKSSAVDVYQCFIGSAVGLSMALFFARLESKYVYPPAPITILFFVYAVLQPLYFVFDSVDYAWVATWLGLFAFVTKAVLFLFVFWMYRHGRLLFYLANIASIQGSIDERWRDFHENDLDVFPEQKPKPDKAPAEARATTPSK